MGCQPWGETLDALGDDRRLAMEVAVLVDHLTGVESDAHLDRRRKTAPVEPARLHLHLTSRRDRAARRGERSHQAVAHLPDERAAIRCDRVKS